MEKNTSVIVKDIYPMVNSKITASGGIKKLNKVIGEFMVYNHDKLYDNAPYHRIYFGAKEINDIHIATNVSEKEIIDKLQYAFFWKKAYNPPQIKEPHVVLLLMIIRHCLLLKEKDDNTARQISLYLALSGKFYPSLHGMVFPKFPPSEYREIMEYVVNMKLSRKFALRTVDGTLIGAIRSIVNTWLETYKKTLISKDCTDEDCGLIIQQLRDRLKSFLLNIADLYYQSYERKDYFNYETEDYSEDNYRVVPNDSTVINKFTDKAMIYISAQNIDLNICNKCASPEVNALEVKSILEDVFSDKLLYQEVYKVVNILINDYLKNNQNGQITSLGFVSYTINAKPNVKDKDLIYVKETIHKWLDEKSANYRRRSKRLATKNNYYNAIMIYLALTIQKGAKK